MAYEVNIMVFKSDTVKCYILDQSNPANLFEHTLHFVRTESEQEISSFDFCNPSAEDLFYQILIDPKKYEVNVPLKACRSNTIYTVKDCTLSDITCDDDGAYSNNNTVDSLFSDPPTPFFKGRAKNSQNGTFFN